MHEFLRHLFKNCFLAVGLYANCFHFVKVAGSGSSSVRTERPVDAEDWTCKKCGNFCYGKHRLFCKMCNEPKPGCEEEIVQFLSSAKNKI